METVPPPGAEIFRHIFHHIEIWFFIVKPFMYGGRLVRQIWHVKFHFVGYVMMCGKFAFYEKILIIMFALLQILLSVRLRNYFPGLVWRKLTARFFIRWLFKLFFLSIILFLLEKGCNCLEIFFTLDHCSWHVAFFIVKFYEYISSFHVKIEVVQKILIWVKYEMKMKIT